MGNRTENIKDSDPNNIHPRRFKEMNKTRNDIVRELKKIRSTPFWGKEIDDCVFNMFERRAQKIGVRGYFVRKIYDYIVFIAQKEKILLRDDIPKDMFTVKLPFIVEGVISLQYLDNQILDRKGGVTTPEKINRNLLASKLFGLFLRREYINGALPLLDQDKTKVSSQLDMMFEFVDIGQWLEKGYGTYSKFVRGLSGQELQVGHIEKYIPYDILDSVWIEIKKDLRTEEKEHEQFIRQYLKRVYLCNASLFVLAAELVMDLLNYNGQERSNILSFAAYYGITIQLVNDNNDYLPLPTVEKTSADVFSDLKNETMSLPLLYYFNHIRKDIKKYNIKLLQNLAKTSGKKGLHKVLPTLLNYSIPATKRIALYSMRLLNKDYKDYELLTNVFSIAHNNKYYQIYKFENMNLNP